MKRLVVITVPPTLADAHLVTQVVVTQQHCRVVLHTHHRIVPGTDMLS